MQERVKKRVKEWGKGDPGSVQRGLEDPVGLWLGGED